MKIRGGGSGDLMGIICYPLVEIGLTPPAPPPGPALSNPEGVSSSKFKPLYNQFVKGSPSNQAAPDADLLPGLNYDPWKQFQNK